MIDIFLRIIDNLVRLIQLKVDIDRKIFENHIEPIYTDLEKIVDDYHSILNDVINNIEGNDFTQASPKAVIVMIGKRRSEYARTRYEVKQYSKVLKENSVGKDIQKFAIATFDFLDVEPVTSAIIKHFPERMPLNTKTAISSLMLDLHNVQDTPSPKRAALTMAKYYVREIDKRWDSVTKSYYQLRIQYLK